MSPQDRRRTFLKKFIYLCTPISECETNLRNYPRLRSALTLKWVSRVGTIIFFVLAIFFAYPYRLVGYRSLFRQSMRLLSISTYSVVYSQFRTIVYICILGFGLLLIATFLKNTKDGGGVKGVAAVNCAWLGFVLQASIELGLQWMPVVVWINLNITLLALFIPTLILLATSLLFLTNYRWAWRLGYLVSWGFLLFNLVGLIIMMKYFVLFLAPFPTLMIVMAISSAVSIYYLGKFDLKNSSGENVHVGRRFSHKLKRFFTSSKILAMILASVLILDSIAFVLPDSYWISYGSATNNFYCGVAFCGTSATEAKLLIDRIKNYTNVFVVQSLPISENEAVLNEICNYAIDSGLSLIVYFRWFDQYWQACWLDTAKQRWGEKFLGVYLYDEPGGLVLDRTAYMGWLGGQVPRNYSEAAESYIRSFRATRGYADMQMLKIRYIKAVTSDYALYWFDYKAGYDVLFGEFGWNYSRQLNVALCRGAATVQNKEWGVMITWTYNDTPYIESGEELYNDMILAYNNGANYVLVFNYPYGSNSTYGILKEEHLEALRKFWNHTNYNHPASDDFSGRVAYVLPKNYGYGFRGPNDKIWGLWEADALSKEIIPDLSNQMEHYGNKLDIIYDDGLEPSNTNVYNKFIFWNGTVYER